MISIEEIHKKIGSVYEMILFPYILLAMPFAFMGAILAIRGLPSLNQILWIAVAMFGARNGGMVLNRLIDMKIDAQNPRTQDRILPRGELSKTTALVLALFFLALFIYSAYKLNPLCFVISPFVIILLIIYSFLKRYTWFVHFFLGIIQSMAPIGAWIAVKGEFSITAFLVGLGVLFWTAGFDIIDKCPDVEFDKNFGLHSIPQWLGVKQALFFSHLFHLIFVFIFIIVYYIYNLGFLFLSGVLIAGIILSYGHYLISQEDLSKVDAVVFYANISVSIIMLVFTFLDVA
ncbi:MAG: UbiA family prenyltransferase [Candidatus Firestonebacteria bacterium]|nr:UbiA family prenyltransferase [Candidatus Firestonebacteria bacterium]